jgi:hypothetical protein
MEQLILGSISGFLDGSLRRRSGRLAPCLSDSLHGRDAALQIHAIK